MFTYRLYIKKQFPSLLILSIALLVAACSSGGSSVTINSGKKTGVAIPQIIAAAVPDPTALSAYIKIDNEPRQQMSIDAGFASIKLTGVSTGMHTFTIEFDYTLPSHPSTPIVLATAAQQFNIVSGDNLFSFDSANYQTEQYDEDGDRISNLTEVKNSTDPFTASPLFNISGISGATTEAGGTATFSVALGSQPNANVTIPIKSLDTSEGNVDTASISFTPSDWDVAQTITVTGVNDTLPDGNQTYSIELGLATSTDSLFSDQNPPDVSVVNDDDDYAIGGILSGYTGTGLVLQNNRGDDLPVSGSVFTFVNGEVSSSNYNVTVLNQPVSQYCIIENQTGVVGTSDVANIVVRCLSDVAEFYKQNNLWNDYIANDGSDIFHAQGLACTNTNACFHAGILRKVDLPDVSSCSDGTFTASDDLNAFSWQCVDGAAGASMVSVALKQGVRLYDLIDVNNQGQWISNTVTIFKNGNLFGKTPTTTDWWSDAINFNPAAGTDLSSEGSVYVFTTNISQSYTITANKVSVVTDPNATVYATSTSSATLTASGLNYLWIEGNFDGYGADNGIALQSVNSSILRNVEVSDAEQIAESAGLLLISSNNNVIEDSTFRKNRWSGIQLSYSNANTLNNIEIIGHDGIYGNPPTDPSGPGPGLWLRTSNNNHINNTKVTRHDDGISIVTYSTGNLITNVNASNNNTGGLYIYLSDQNVFDQVTTSNNGGYGIYFLYGQYNIVSQFTNHNSSTYGARFIESNYNIFSYGTLANSLGYGFSFEHGNQTSDVGSTHNLLFGVAIVNNNYSGLSFSSSSNNTVGNIVIANNGNTAFPAGVNLYSSDNNYFTGIYKSGGNVGGDCYLDTSVVMTNPGLNADCTPQGASDFGAIVPINLSNTTFTGKLTIVDQSNSTIQQGGSALYADIKDWSHFSNPFRGWGLDGTSGTPFPDISQQGRCTDTTVAPCRIWDWTLNSQDTIARQALAAPDPLQVIQVPWVAGGSITFLRDAVEISNDGRGNDNTLCEPNNNEACIAAYNIASYQGSGTLVDITTPAMSAAGITMYSY